MYLGAVALALASRLPFRFYLARVWLFVPIFTGIVVLPATLNVITPGTIVVPLGRWFGGRVGLTAEGLESAGLIVMRAAVSIALVVLLTLTTPWARLLAALRSLKVPTTVILVLAMAYRYLFHLLTSVDDMYTARTARTVDRDRGARRRPTFRRGFRGGTVREGARPLRRGLPGDGGTGVHRRNPAPHTGSRPGARRVLVRGVRGRRGDGAVG